MPQYKDIEPITLERFPEIWKEYLLERDLKDYANLKDWIAELYQMPVTDDRRLGATIVFDNLLVPMIINLLRDANHARLQELFDWLEILASSKDFNIRYGLLKVTLCEAFLSNHSTFFSQIYPFIETRPNLLSLFKETSNQFRLSKGLLDLLEKTSQNG